MAGAEGFEPSNAGIKIRCVRPLRHAPFSYFIYHDSMAFPAALKAESDKRARILTLLKYSASIIAKLHPIKGEYLTLWQQNQLNMKVALQECLTRCAYSKPA